jgi:hypothetical protein
MGVINPLIRYIPDVSSSFHIESGMKLIKLSGGDYLC